MASNSTFNEEHLRKFLDYIYAPEIGCIEFRAWNATISKANKIEPSTYKTTYGGWFDRKDFLLFEARRLKEVCGYITVNPVKKDLLARANNKLIRLKKGESPGTHDEDVAMIRHMIIDIDSKHPAGASATEEEVAATVELRDHILASEPSFLGNCIWGRSGNGSWILLRLPDYPNDDEHRKLVKNCLKSMAATYNEYRKGLAYIDTNTANPSRHLGIPGTLKCKGSSIVERPWRMITIDGGL